MDERTVLRLRRLQQAGELQETAEGVIHVQIALADSDQFTLQGVVDFQDNQVDPATGTQRMRAVIENSDGLLSPGLFVRIRYPVGTARESLLIPEECLASDQGRPFVFVVQQQDGQDVAAARYIETGPLEGGMRVIRDGLTLQDQVIATGLQRLRRNAEIKAQPRPEPSNVDKATPASN
jgi:RND family efflux transporter MFP subunit